MKIVLAAQEPSRAVRVKMVKRSLSRRYYVRILEPRFTVRGLGRVPSALLRYGTYALQEGLVDCEALHLFSSPDFIHMLSIFRRVRICYDYRSNYAEKLALEYRLLGSLATSLEYKLASRADLLITVNDILASRLKALTGKKVYVVPNYPSRSFRARRSRDEILNEIGVDGPTALFIGGLTYTYNFDLLMEAASRLNKVWFIIIGSGPLYEYVKKRAPPNMLLLGWKPHNLIADYIQAADVCLAPIRRYTAKPVSNDQDVWKVSEYAALGKPIVATGLAPSKQYLLVEGVDKFVQGVLDALRGGVAKPEPKFWENYSEPALYEAYSSLQSQMAS
ncbi:MAG: glycosyltransferase [Nitrososphaerales archaeon]